jgi:predicted phosphoribosyltransferase
VPYQTDRASRSLWPAERDRFDNRTEAGRSLGKALLDRLGRTRLERVLVLGLPRGGVPVACAVAEVLSADLDVLVSHKVASPWCQEVTVGAIVDEGEPLLDWDALGCANVRTNSLGLALRASRDAVRQRRHRYRGSRPAASFARRTVVITDDGLTPGLVARAAVRTVRASDPAMVVFVAPVYPAEAMDWLRAEADAVCHLHSPRAFHAIGLWYRNLAPVTDDDVTRLLTTAWDGDH